MHSSRNSAAYGFYLYMIIKYFSTDNYGVDSDSIGVLKRWGDGVLERRLLPSDSRMQDVAAAYNPLHLNPAPVALCSIFCG